MRAARPDYTRKSRNSNRKKKSGIKGQEPDEGKDDIEAGEETLSQAPAPQSHQLELTSEGHILVGSGGGDERRWWEKW